MKKIPTVYRDLFHGIEILKLKEAFEKAHIVILSKAKYPAPELNGDSSLRSE